MPMIDLKKLINLSANLLFLVILTTPTKGLSDRLTPEQLWSLGQLSDPQSSPNGKWVVYGVLFYDINNNRSNRDLYLISSKGGKALKKV